ncbi:MAG: glycosyltransferase 87 family protein [Terriglobales bacterium]
MKLDLAGRNGRWLVLAASLLVCFGVWRWAGTILVPEFTAQAVAKGRPIGNNSDLYPRWLGTRELLLHGRDPYGADVTRQIQIGYYGRQLDPKKPADPIDQVAFAYPLYVVFLLAPSVNLSFASAAAIFRWAQLLGTACSVPLWMYAIGFRPPRLLVFSGMILSISTFSAVQEFHMQNLSALVILLLSAAAAAAVHKWLWLSGFLLALSTIKPQISGLLILWFMLWAAGRWRERKHLVWSFVGTMTGLVGAAEAVSPHWIGRFLKAAAEYQSYAANPSILQALLPSLLATLLAATLVILLAFRCWRWRESAAGSTDFGWALAWVSAVTLTILPKLAAYNQPLLILALLVLVANYEFIGKAGLLPRAFIKAAFGCQIWQWVAALVLALASLPIPAARLHSAAEVPLYTWLSLTPITLLAVIIATFPLERTGRRTAAVPIPQTLAAPRE